MVFMNLFTLFILQNKEISEQAYYITQKYKFWKKVKVVFTFKILITNCVVFAVDQYIPKTIKKLIDHLMENKILLFVRTIYIDYIDFKFPVKNS